MSISAPLAVTMMIGTWLRLRSCRQTSMPLMRGSITSSSTRSGLTMSKRSRASKPSIATSTWNPSRRSPIVSASTKLASSSTTSTVGVVIASRSAAELSVGSGAMRSVSTDRTGMRSTNVEPSPSWDDTSTSPRWLVATWRTMARPSPVPPVSRLRALSTR